MPVRSGGMEIIMDDTIKRILEIENRAQEIVGEAKSQQENFTQILSDELEQLEKSTMKRADLRIEKLRRFDEQEAANKMKAMQAETELNIQKMRDIHAQNGQKWEEDIFHRVIGS